MHPMKFAHARVPRFAWARGTRLRYFTGTPQ